MLELDRAVHEALLAHARAGAPEEVCGVLGGTRGSPRRATTARRARNAAAEPRTEYRIAPDEQLELMTDIESGGDDVVGFYHSHPAGPAGPSPTDERLATWPGRAYVIVDLGGPEPRVAAWRWTGERFVDEPLRVVEG